MLRRPSLLSASTSFRFNQKHPRTEDTMAKKNILITGLILIALFYLPVLFLSETALLSITSEDNIYESATSLFFFFASIGFMYLFIKVKNRNVFFLLFSLAFLFAAGEEISWGQRILNFETPEAIERVNAQKEFSLHNLDVIQHERNEDGYKVSLSLKSLLNFNRLFILFWLLYCVLVPITYRFFGMFRSFFTRIRLPIPSLWLGILFLINELLCKGLEFYLVNYKHYNQEIPEIKEALWAVIIFLMVIYFINEYGVRLIPQSLRKSVPATS
jgi:hypothetical protein